MDYIYTEAKNYPYEPAAHVATSEFLSQNFVVSNLHIYIFIIVIFILTW